MFKSIVRKELLGNVLSFRFVVTLALLLIVVPVTTFVLTSDYLKKVSDASVRQAETETYLRSYAHFNRIGAILQTTMPPLASEALVRGLSADVNLSEFDDDPLPVMFPLVDLVFVVTILMSLVALIFAYDAVSGEKEDGTLKLMLANGLARPKVILAKIVGGGLTLLVPYVMSLIVGLLVILAHPGVGWSTANWGALGLITIGTVLYIMLFYALGVFISAKHHASSSSIMTSLLVWVLLVLVVPSLSPYIASFLAPTPSRIEIEREAQRLGDTARDELGRKLEAERMREVTARYPILAQNYSDAERKRLMERDPAAREAFEAATKAWQGAWDEANRIQGEKIREVWKAAGSKEEAQTGLSRTISMVSPLAVFTYLATDLSSTGMRNTAYFDRVGGLRDRWDRAFDDYSRKKIAELQAKDPTTDWWNTAVDMSDRPRFEYREEGLGARVLATLPEFVLLLAGGLVFFVLAYVSFLRYDVR
jgi:ABC-type transport system involved in multi-copper enzyme maturation permease subunit